MKANNIVVSRKDQLKNIFHIFGPSILFYRVAYSEATRFLTKKTRY